MFVVRRLAIVLARTFGNLLAGRFAAEATCTWLSLTALDCPPPLTGRFLLVLLAQGRRRLRPQTPATADVDPAHRVVGRACRSV